MKDTSLERINPDEDWPPIFSLHIKADVSASEVRDLLGRAPEAAKVYVVLEEGGLPPDEVEEIVARQVDVVSIRVTED